MWRSEAATHYCGSVKAADIRHITRKRKEQENRALYLVKAAMSCLPEFIVRYDSKMRGLGWVFTVLAY